MTSKRTINAIATVSSLPVLLAASWLYYPRAFDGPVVCMFKILLGVPCFGCGLTRAFASMMHGEIGYALVYHPVAPLVLVWIACWWALEIRALFRAHPSPRGPGWFQSLSHVVLFMFIALWWTRTTVFFASPEGLKSLLTKNLYMRIVRGDFSNTHEVFSLDSKPPPR